MRVLLINPFYPISETPSPPLGLAYLAAALTESGVEIKILDLVVFPYSRSMLQNLLEAFKPQMAGLTAVTMTFDSAIGVIKDIKEIDPDILTVMGGPHVSFCGRETLKDYPELDVIVIGEGEHTVVELCRAANSRSLLPLGRYRALKMPISMTTSRGCPFKCIFCVGRKMVGARVRYRNPKKIVDELAYLSTLNFHQINIADDLFTANKDHCLAVCDEIIKRDLKLTWTSFARVDTVSDDMLTRMKTAGCNAVSFGIESANPQILKTIKKGITLEQVEAAVGMCKRAGVTPYASFILGLPGETPQTIKETMDFGEKMKSLGLAFGFHLLAPFPGTEVREQSDKYGIKILTDDWSRYHANRAVVETPEVNRRMLDEIVIEWEDEYNQLLADIKQRMQKNEASDEEALQVINLERIVLIYDLMMKNEVERRGSWSHDGGPESTEESLKKLAAIISRFSDATPEMLYSTLGQALAEGNLTCTDRNGSVRWQWVDRLE
ncbi:MAG: cobalamin-dependent protein [Deltaproteobacteria bacterium]|nr:cobalamin-dependent protein [Deltaproteobacteria bacterium]